jgi:2-polyprenyl-3-methyl-5-hydroxy-6-metoxy-1,4-benzoquinol methylase
VTDNAFRRLRVLVRAKFPNYAEAWDRAADEFGPSWEAELSELIERSFGKDESAWAPAVDGYAEFCTDALRSQIFFERKGRYKASSYADVAQACYHNADFMFRSYLPGMLLSHYVWPHHHRMLKWFRSLVPTFSAKTFAEVGVGCGIYSKESLRLFPGSRGAGFDISEHALAFTKRVAQQFDMGDRYDTNVQDIIAKPPPQFDLVICQEVLEHLEDPAAFCKALFGMTRPGGHAYITAAINAAHVDHIYLYRSLQQALDQIEAAGFKILATHEELAYGGKPVEITPCLGGALAARPAGK